MFLVSLLLVVAIALSATASVYAKGGGGTTTVPSIALIPPATLGPVTSTWQPALGDQVNFAVTYGKVRNPRVEVLCYQPTDPSGYARLTDKGYLVYAEARGATPDQFDYMGTYPFVLGSGMSAWLLDGGTASCTANLFYFGKSAGQETYNLLATTQFTASGN